MINDLFSFQTSESSSAPTLAHSLRPEAKKDYVGFEQLVEKYPLLNNKIPRSMISHDGSAALRIIEKPELKLTGRYWTERLTKGELVLNHYSDAETITWPLWPHYAYIGKHFWPIETDILPPKSRHASRGRITTAVGEERTES